MKESVVELELDGSPRVGISHLVHSRYPRLSIFLGQEDNQVRGSQSMTPPILGTSSSSETFMTRQRTTHAQDERRSPRPTSFPNEAWAWAQQRSHAYVKGSIILGILDSRGRIEPPTTSTTPNPLGKRSTTKTRAKRKRFEIPQKCTPQRYFDGDNRRQAEGLGVLCFYTHSSGKVDTTSAVTTLLVSLA